MYRRALAASAAAIVLSIIAMSPMFSAAASTTAASTTAASATVSIAQVQGSGAATPFDGREVTVRGIVTGVLPSFGGMYIQSATPSGVDGASDGIFVLTTGMGDTAASAGDLVSVTGTAGEAASQTEIVASSVSLLQSAVGLPTATPLADSVVGAAREAFEGMLVTPTGSYYLSSVDDAQGSLELSAGSETADVASRIILDDGVSGTVAEQPFLPSDTAIRAGDLFVAPQRPLVLAQGASGYRLEPLAPVTAASDAASKPKFVADSPRLGDAPTVAP